MSREEWELLERERALRHIVDTETRFPTAYQNDHCNRYRDVLANEATRVHLPSPHPYINANHVRVYDCADNECADSNVRSSIPFICTQAPLPHTTVDFYHMAVRQGAKAIVSLVDSYRGAQASRYFPMLVGDQFTVSNDCHTVTVTAKDAQSLCNGAIIQRTLEIHLHPLDNQCRTMHHTLHHFSFTQWPDRDVPSDPDALFYLVRLVRSICGARGLSIVHCSAGVGRTGVYVLLDYILHAKMNKSRPISLVRCIRSQREHMVQTIGQYRFVHEAWERSKDSEKKAQPNMKEASALFNESF